LFPRIAHFVLKCVRGELSTWKEALDHISPQHRDDALQEQIARCRELLETHTSALVSDSERMLDAVARLADVGYWEDDVETNRLSWSAQACAVIGVPPTERERAWDEFRQLVHPDDRPAVDHARARVHRGEALQCLGFRTLLSDGTTRWVETVAEPVRDQHGEIVRVVGAIRDVSDRKAAEGALRGSEERLQLALQATGLGPWDWDLTTNEAVFWPEWKRQIGYERHELLGGYQEWESRIHPDDRERVLLALRAYRAGNEPEYAAEFRLRHKNGSYRWIYTRGVTASDDTGKKTHMIGCHLDITERKQLEEQYRQSHKMQAIGQLAGGIAHDFNNLLTAINGYAELVAAELPPSHSSQQDVGQIRAAAMSAATLTRQLLAFSRRQILKPQVLVIDRTLYGMQQLLTRIIGENIELNIKLCASGRVMADAGQIEQVVINLAVNARDAMPDGGKLLIETADVDLDAMLVAHNPGAAIGRHVMIAVSDTGSGMDAETRAHLFEPFFTTKPAGRGTGLGLATVYGIVKQSGGSISVYSERGLGTTFKIYLPTTNAGSEPPPIAADTSALRGTETVLVVEDQGAVRDLIEKTLRRFGYAVITAGTTSQASTAVRGHSGPIDVMLTDVVLPDGNGREVARRTLAIRPSMRVLYMSGYTDEAIVHHGVLDEGLAFIQKPFTAEQIVQKIREVLDAELPPAR
jgi:two-component system, cell cycle sensor histidine kinase and response regulator CckA